MKFQLSEEAVLWTSAACTSTYAAHQILAPKHAQEFYFTSGDRNDAATRWHGHGLACCASIVALTAANGNYTPEGRRRFLQLGAFGWGSVLAHTAGNVARKIQKNDATSWVQMGGMAAMAAAHAYKGFKKAGSSGGSGSSGIAK